MSDRTRGSYGPDEVFPETFCEATASTQSEIAMSRVEKRQWSEGGEADWAYQL
jgi:hypothetical protein